MARAYVDYKIYLPAFIDFRGRISRAGMLHFHERDLAKSLISLHNQFLTTLEDLEKYYSTDYRHVTRLLEEAVGFHHHSFESREEA
jgi:DNA-directed RNA polymerase